MGRVPTHVMQDFAFQPAEFGIGDAFGEGTGRLPCLQGRSRLAADQCDHDNNTPAGETRRAFLYLL